MSTNIHLAPGSKRILPYRGGSAAPLLAGTRLGSWSPRRLGVALWIKAGVVTAVRHRGRVTPGEHMLLCELLDRLARHGNDRLAPSPAT